MFRISWNLRAVPGFPGYAVSDRGEVVSPNRVLKPRLTRDGYTHVEIAGKDRLIHHLVLLAYVGPRPARMQTRHLDGNARNNALGNLCYGTPRENSMDSHRHGTHCGKLNRQQACEVYRLAKGRIKRGRPRNGSVGLTRAKIAERYHISRVTVSAIVNGRTWGWATGAA